MRNMNKLWVGAAGITASVTTLVGSANAAEATPPPVRTQAAFVNPEHAIVTDPQVVVVEMARPEENDRGFLLALGSVTVVAGLACGAGLVMEREISKQRQG